MSSATTVPHSSRLYTDPCLQFLNVTPMRRLDYWVSKFTVVEKKKERNPQTSPAVDTICALNYSLAYSLQEKLMQFDNVVHFTS